METENIFYFTKCTLPIIGRMETEIRLIGLGYVDCKEHSIETYRRIQPYYTIHFVISGKGHLEVNKKTFAVNQYDIFALPSSTPFRYYPDENDPWSYAFFEFNGSFAQSYLKDCAFSLEQPIQACPTPIKITERAFSVFSKLYESGTVSYYESMSLLLDILSSLSITQKTIQTRDNYFIDEIKSYIKLHCLDSDFSVTLLANIFHISYTYLSKIFKQKTGKTLISYITKQKMLHAKHLLKNTNYSVYDICFMSGFNNYPHFLSTFKSLYGCTATQYRLSSPPRKMNE